jgi:hypothetical protein
MNNIPAGPPSAGRKPLVERLLDCFPSGTYALPTLLRLLDVVESRDVPTAAVQCRAEPRLFLNPDFADTWAATAEKLLMLVMHELHHVLLGHTRLFPRLRPVDNFVFDTVINSLQCRMFPAPEYLAFLTDFYADDRFPESSGPSGCGSYMPKGCRWARSRGRWACTELQSFAAGLRQDEAAVAAALTGPWGNGPVEGQVNRADAGE